MPSRLLYLYKIVIKTWLSVRSQEQNKGGGGGGGRGGNKQWLTLSQLHQEASLLEALLLRKAIQTTLLTKKHSETCHS